MRPDVAGHPFADFLDSLRRNDVFNATISVGEKLRAEGLEVHMSDSGAPARGSQDAARLLEARDKGCAYLLGQQRSDGGFGPTERGLADYYKVPAAYLV